MLNIEFDKSEIKLSDDNLLCIEFFPKNVRNSSKFIYMGEVNDNKQMHGYGKLWNEIIEIS